MSDFFIWDQDNIEHIARHSVEPYEAEEAITDPKRIRFDAHSGHHGIIGQSIDGRRLVVIFVIKIGNKFRVITARDANDKERKMYNRRNKS